jgi:hypothetical protein
VFAQVLGLGATAVPLLRNALEGTNGKPAADGAAATTDAEPKRASRR